MTDRPIIFSAPMVRALLEGRKTQTRRLAYRYKEGINHEGVEGLLELPTAWQKCKPGDLLWVRESIWSLGRWVNTEDETGERDSHWIAANDVSFMADGKEPTLSIRQEGMIWRPTPSIHMPRWASRITLEVTGVKVERVQEISEEDARCEGLGLIEPAAWKSGASTGNFFIDPRKAFQELWEYINGPDSWSANPLVVAITFKVHKCNIDKIG